MSEDATDEDDVAKVRADFEALKARLQASVAELDPERYDRELAQVVALDEDAVWRMIAKRRDSARVADLLAEMEERLAAAEERERERA